MEENRQSADRALLPEYNFAGVSKRTKNGFMVKNFVCKTTSSCDQLKDVLSECQSRESMERPIPCMSANMEVLPCRTPERHPCSIKEYRVGMSSIYLAAHIHRLISLRNTINSGTNSLVQLEQLHVLDSCVDVSITDSYNRRRVLNHSRS